ncbi:hypothetical protein D3C80_1489820 [compost metagenome]
MAVPVIDCLEEVDINQDHGRRKRVLTALRYFPLQLLCEIMPVIAFSEAVGNGHLRQLAVGLE